MNTRKVLNASTLIAMTVLITLGLVWQPAAAKSGTYRLIEGETIELGMQGLHATNIPRGVSSAYLDMVGNDLPAWFSRNIDVEYRLPAMEVGFLDEKGDTVERISALVYVFFNLTRAERNLWFEGGMEKIAIWYVDPVSRIWELCPTHFVNANGEEGKFDRLACLAKGSGYYIVGQGDFEEEVLNLYNTESKVISASQYVPQ